MTGDGIFRKGIEIFTYRQQPDKLTISFEKGKLKKIIYTLDLFH